jgi:Spirocyclase AveC-like
MSARADHIPHPLAFGQEKSAVVTLMAWTGAFFTVMTLWVWGKWVMSPQFHPVDPGPDAIPRGEYLMIIAFQIAAVALTLWMIWHYVISPKIRTGSFSTDGIIVLVLPLMWFQDPFFNYSQNWFTYNAYLLNMGSWAGAPVPGWLGANGNRFPEPLVVGFCYIAWIFGTMIVGTWCLNQIKRRRPSISLANLLILGTICCFFIDLAIEYPAVRIGWYAMPGAWQAFSIHPGTRYQVSLVEITVGGVQTIFWVSLRYFKDDKGQTWADRGVDNLRLGPVGKFWVRFMAITGALSLLGLIYTIPIQWQGQHTDVWPAGLPSYFTTTCPEYKVDRTKCGGPGVPMHRPNYVWLPKQ